MARNIGVLIEREPAGRVMPPGTVSPLVNVMSPLRGSELIRTAAAGVVVFVFGYLVTWILAGAKVANLFVGGPFGGSVPDWKATLWVFYDSHFVGTRTPRVFGPDGGLWGGGDLVDTVSLLDVEYLYAVPVVLLLVAGAVVASWAGATSPREGLFAGGTIVSGYVVAVILGLFAGSQGGVAPDTLRAVAIAGVVYPIAFGALGGAVAGLVADETSEARGDAATR
jgi:hypothetical protein